MKKAYNPQDTEKEIYKKWEESGYFNPDKLPHVTDNSPAHVIHMPLPNVTGSLHIGHALDHTIQDFLTRWHRMRGFRAVWYPGTDHAGIATQNVVEKQLKKEGKTRFDLGREKFIERVWEWKEEYGDKINQQMRLLGNSCDWSRYRFTMDDKYAEAVTDTFIHYYEKGFIYRGNRVINWCPRCATSLSDLETEYKEKESSLAYITYPLADEDGSVTVATTRPETMLGDAAVAVSPSDERYKNLIGKKIMLPIQNRRIPIVAYHKVDSEFGTGAVKVTPSHDMLDSEIAEEHDLPYHDIIDETGRMTEEAGEEFEGLKAKEAREKVVSMLYEKKLIEKEEPYTHNLAICYRCNCPLQPQRSAQWYLKMDKLAERALDAVDSESVRIVPNNFEKPYRDWLENIHDWCISRQIWWGHRIPVWFCSKQQEESGGLTVDKEEEFVVSRERPETCPECGACEMEQAPDVLDTWFSSALWPFAALSNEDLKAFYPSTTLVTARDILNLWVARMIFSGIEFMEEPPFKNVVIHGTVLTKDGKRMSKSLGTGIDPVKVIDEYSADALRFAILWQSMGQQDIRWTQDAVIAGKKFANKVWNASRFVLMQLDDDVSLTKEQLSQALSEVAETDEDARRFLDAFNTLRSELEEEVAEFKLGHALHNLYDFFWHTFCDECIEAFKDKDGEKMPQFFLLALLIEQIKLLHPFMPFLTEHLYGLFPIEDKELLMIEQI